MVKRCVRALAILTLLFAAGCHHHHRSHPPPTPTPYGTVNANFYGADWNSVTPGNTPNPWCPQDSSGAQAKLASFRVWDDGMKWSQVETISGSTNTFTWTKLDYLMSTLVTNPSCPMSVVYTVGSTPPGATACAGKADPSTCLPGPTGSGFGGGSQCASPGDWSCLPPSDIATNGTGNDAYFQTFIATLLSRYPNQIGFIEVGNEWDSPNFWCNSTAVAACGSSSASLSRAVRMGWDALNLMHCISPTTVLVSPSMHVGTASTWFDNYLNTSINAPAGNITVSGHTCTWAARTVTGKTILNGSFLPAGIVNMHMRGTSSTNTDPTSVIAAYNAIAGEMSSQGLLSLPLWNDEWGLNGGQCANMATGAAYMGEQLSLMASFSNPSIAQEHFYMWDNNDCVASKSIVGLAHDVVAGWLTGATVSNYSKVGTVYTINGIKSGSGFSILFDSSKTCSGTTISTCAAASQSAGSFTTCQDLSGNSCTISGGSVQVGMAPIKLAGGGITTFTIGGTTTGLTGTGMVLQNNGGNNLSISANGAFTFSTAIASGSAYNVTVLTQPTGQTCSVASGSGTATANVTSVVVTCSATTFTVGGSVINLASGSVVLQNNGGNNLTMSANGTFTFSNALASGSTYNVTVLTQPPSQTCTIPNGTGTVSANVTNIHVTCSAITYTIGGTVSGSTGTVVLQNNGGDNKSVTSNTSFTFATAISSGSTYNVTVLTPPAGQTCTVSNGSGTATGNVTNVGVTCSTITYTIGGTVSGLSGTVVLQNNSADNLSRSTNTSFTFATPVANGAVYNVTVLTQPSGQTCNVTNATGTVVSANVTNVTVTCGAGITYTARTDVTAQPYPSTIPCPYSGSGCTLGNGSLTGAGWAFTPSDFATPIVRLTDKNMGSTQHQFNTSCDSSSEVNDFNLNKDRVTMCEAGNTQRVFAMNTSTYALTYDSSFTTPGLFSMYWSYTQAYIAYHAHRNGSNDLAIFSYDFTCGSGIATCNPTPTQVVDLGTACSIGVLTGSASATTTEGLTVSGDDQTFAVLGSTSPSQGTAGAQYAIVWNRTNGCTYWNTGTGHVFVNGADQGALAITDTFYMHNMRLAKSGAWLKVSMQSGTCQSTCASNFNYFWQIASPKTVNISLQTSNGCGHTAIGYNFWVNKCATGHNANDELEASFTAVNTNTSLPAAFPSPVISNSAHINWGSDNASDTNPFFSIMQAAGFAAVDGWDNEILESPPTEAGRCIASRTPTRPRRRTRSFPPRSVRTVRCCCGRPTGTGCWGTTTTPRPPATRSARRTAAPIFSSRCSTRLRPRPIQRSA